MFFTKFLDFFKRRRRSLLLSILIILAYFVGSSLITPKITLVAENLLKDVIKENISSKKSSIAFEFNRLNSYLSYSEDLIEDYIVENKLVIEKPFQQNSFLKLKDKLLFVTELAQSTNLISNSFIYNSELDNIKDTYFESQEHELDIATLFKQLEFIENKAYLDTIISTPEYVVNRKLYARKINSETTIVVGYDVDLLKFWAYFSETSRGGSGYTVVTNKDGICILHPEIENIGKKLDGFFKNVSINDILLQESQLENASLNVSNTILRDTAISKFLDLEVLRYYDKIKIGDTPLLLIESFPVEINLKEATEKIQSYFSWISLLAFLIFGLLLLISRLQLKKEYADKLKVVKEKEKLEIANEKYQRQNAVLELNQLKKKMKPHFLFNSLNSLHVLIESEPNLSQEFVSRLANVYRYLLVGKEGSLVKLDEELEFMNQYIFLQEIRFRESLEVEIVYNTDARVSHKRIPFLSLQSLVENAIKHNVVTKDNPLRIEVVIDEHVILVSNYYTPRKKKEVHSHNLGLEYLKNIYEHHDVYSFEAKLVEGKFCCSLPLLSLP